MHLCVPSRIQTRGLSMSHRVNDEAAALTTQPPRVDLVRLSELVVLTNMFNCYYSKVYRDGNRR